MELRRLCTESERASFRRMMHQTRATRGGAFKENGHSKVSEIQLSFAHLFALYDESSPDPDQPLGGFTLHALNEFGQTFPSPDLSCYAPNVVFEGGQLWSVDYDSALALRMGSLIALALLQAQAFLIYPMVIPKDVSKLYRKFRRIGNPFILPFATTIRNEPVWLQAMILDGNLLSSEINRAVRRGFNCSDNIARIRFDRPMAHHHTMNGTRDSLQASPAFDVDELVDKELNGGDASLCHTGDSEQGLPAFATEQV